MSKEKLLTIDQSTDLSQSPASLNVASNLRRFATRVALGAVLTMPIACGNSNSLRTHAPIICNDKSYSGTEEDKNVSREMIKQKISTYAGQHVYEWISTSKSAAEVQLKFSQGLREFAQEEGINFCVFDKEPDVLPEASYPFDTPNHIRKLLLVKISSAGISTVVADRHW